MQLTAYYFILPVPVILEAGLGYGGDFGIIFTNAHIVFVQILALTLSMAYLCGFRFAFGPSKTEDMLSSRWTRNTHRALWVFFIGLAVCDLYFRVNAIFSGTYFSWMRKFATEEARSSSSLFLILINSLTPLIAALAAYFSRENRKILIYLIIFVGVVVLEGRRTSVVLVFFAIASVYLFDHRFIGTIIKKLKLIGFLIIALIFIMSVILDVRREFRSDIKFAVENPVGFIFGATGSSMLDVLGVSTDEKSSIELRGAGFSDRSSAHLVVFASVVKRYFDGYDLLPVAYFIEDTLRAVPSVIAGKKSGYSAGNVLANHFEFDTTASGHSDPASTVYLAMFALSGPFGCVLLALFAGIAFGLLFRFLAFRYGPDAWVLAVGLVGILMIDANNYSALITNLRHFVMLIILLEIIVFCMRLRLHPRRRVASSRSSGSDVGLRGLSPPRQMDKR
jgi:hypothetical protein